MARIHGTAHRDNLHGTAHNDTLRGGPGADHLNGGRGNDHVYGGAGADVLHGGPGNDTLTGGPGNDHIDGGQGNDTAVFSGNFADYDITAVNGGFQVTEARGNQKDGTDFVASNVESLKFADMTVPAGTGGASAQAPSVNVGGGSLNFDLGGPLQSIGVAPSVAINDPDSNTLANAHVAISQGFQPGDTLSFADQNGIHGVYDAANGVLTLSGQASVADYQSALASVEFTPADSAGDRTLDFSVNDGLLTSDVTPTTSNIIDVGM